MPPWRPERSYTKSSISTAGSTAQLLKLDAEAAIAEDVVAEAAEDELADRIDCKQRTQAKPTCLPQYR